MQLTPSQQEIAHDPSRFRVLIAGRRFGKSFLAIRELAYHARLPNRTVWYVAPTYKQARMIVFKPLVERLRSLRWITKVNETNLEINLRNGSTIALKGADGDATNLRGVGVDFIVLDEFADINPEAWYAAIRPVLSDRGGKALFIGTPKGIGNWSYDIYQQAKTLPDWNCWQRTTEQGGNVPIEEIETARAELDEKHFNQEYQATFETFTGRIYYNFDRATHVRKEDLAEPRHIFIGGDFNVDPMSFTVAVQLGTRHWHVIDAIRIYGSNTQEMIEEVNQRYPRARKTVWPDSAGRQRKTSAGGMTDILLLQNAGWDVRAPNRNPPVKDRIAAVNSLLKSSTGTVGLTFEPAARACIEGLERQTYKEGTQIPDKSSEYDDINDALGYFVVGVAPIRREKTVEQPSAWRRKIGS